MKHISKFFLPFYCCHPP